MSTSLQDIRRRQVRRDERARQSSAPGVHSANPGVGVVATLIAYFSFCQPPPFIMHNYPLTF